VSTGSGFGSGGGFAGEVAATVLGISAMLGRASKLQMKPPPFKHCHHKYKSISSTDKKRHIFTSITALFSGFSAASLAAQIL
jgi:hypothetical protein